MGAFNGLTRVADATGIALDGGTLAATPDLRTELGLNTMAGAKNTVAVAQRRRRAAAPADRGGVVPGLNVLPVRIGPIAGLAAAVGDVHAAVRAGL